MPTAIQIGVLALMAALVGLAQRFGEYRNKSLARALNLVATAILVWSCFWFLPHWVAWLVAALSWSITLWFIFSWTQGRLRISGIPPITTQPTTLQRTPDGLRKYVSVLAGDLYSVLVELGEDNNRPESDDIPIILAATDKDKAVEKLLRSLPPAIYAEDHRVMRRIAEMRFDDRLRQVAAYARELGLWNEPNPLSVMFPKSSLDKTLPELLTVDPKNADDVKHKNGWAAGARASNSEVLPYITQPLAVPAHSRCGL